MADQSGKNRISLRVPEDLFRKLNKKRFEEDTTFQEIGLNLFKDWLTGEKQPSPDPDPDAAMLLECKQIASPDDYAALRQNVLVFLRDARRALASRQRKGA